MATYEHMPPISGALQRVRLNEAIQRAEHALYTFFPPAYLRYHNPEERIGQVHTLGSAIDAYVTAQPTHLQYVHRDTTIEVPLIEQDNLYNKLEIFSYLAGPFYNCRMHNRGGGPRPEAREQLRRCFEGILQFEDKAVIHAWAQHINVLDPPMSHWTEAGDLESYELSGYRTSHPINLFQVFADGEEPRGIRSENWIVHRGQLPRWNPRYVGQDEIEAIPNYKYQEKVQSDEDVAEFIAEIDTLMAEADDELPPEGTLPKAAPTG